MFRIRRSSLRLAAWLGAAWLAAAALAPARAVQYVLDLPANQMIAYRISLKPGATGVLVLEADWTGSRVLSFRLFSPRGRSVRRTGPPPQRFEVDIRPEEVPVDEPWVLSIRGLPVREASSGLLTVTLPEEAAAAAAQAAALAAHPAAAQAPAPAPEPWAAPRATPAGLPPELGRLHAATEAFRALVVDDVPDLPDTCEWQVDLLRELARQRDAAATTPDALAESTRRVLTRMVRVVDEVEGLRTSDDPILTGPAPENPSRRRAWTIVRQERLEPLRSSLDDLLTDITRGYAPELKEAPWPVRFLSCLTACERHFEERVLRGEDAAPNSRLARDQWERIRAAARALDAMLDVTRSRRDEG